MRTSDKLMDSSSYFHAELKRLKMLKEKAATGQEMLILLDEILKGTNSQDKLKGSILVLKKFITYNVAGILATHDTALGELEKEYVENYDKVRDSISMDNLKKIIDAKGFSTTKVAIESKISDSAIISYISGSKIPSLPVLISIANYLNCNLDYLVGRTDNPIKIDDMSKSYNDKDLMLLLQNINSLPKDKQELVKAYVKGLMDN